MRKLIKIFALIPALIVSAVFILLALAIIFINTQWGKSEIVKIIEKQSKNYLYANLEIGKLEGNYLSNLKINDVLLSMEKDTLISFKSLSIKYNLRSLLKKEIQIDFIKLTNPVIKLSQLEDSTWNLMHLTKPLKQKADTASQDTSDTKYKIILDRLLIKNGSIIIDSENKNIPEKIDGLFLDLKAKIETNEQTLVLNKLSLKTIKPDIKLEKMSFNISIKDEFLKLSDFQIKTKQNKISLQAEIDLTNKYKSILVFNTDPLIVEEFSYFLPDGFSLKANPEIKFKGELSDTMLGINIRLRYLNQGAEMLLVSDNFKKIINETDKSLLDYKVSLVFDKFNIDEWSGFTDINTILDGYLNVEGNGIDYKKIQAKLKTDLNNSVVYGYKLDILKLNAKLDRQKFGIDFDAGFSDFVQGDLRVANGKISANFKGDIDNINTKLDLDFRNITQGETVFDSLIFKTSGDVKQLKQFDFYSNILMNNASVSFGTDFSFGKSINIDLSRLLLAYKDQVWKQDSLVSNIVIGTQNYSIKNLSISSPGSNFLQKIKFDGEISRIGNQNFNLTIDSLDINKILKTIGNKTDVTGLFSLNSSLTGAAQSPVLNTDFRINDIVYQTYEVGQVSGKIDLFDKLLSLEAYAYPPLDGKIKLNGSIPANIRLDSMKFDISTDKSTPVNGLVIIDSIPLELAQMFLPFGEITGMFNALININGTIGKINPNGNINIMNGKFTEEKYGIYYSDIHADIKINDRKVTVDTFVINSRKGSLFADGSYDKAESGINIIFNSFRPFDHKNYNMQVEGYTNLSLKSDSGYFSGEITIPRTEIYLPAVLQLMGKAQPDNYPKPLLVEALERNSGKVEIVTTENFKKDTLKIFDKLKGKLKVIIPKNTWIKNEDMRMELSGNLDIIKQASFPEIFGQVNIIRGQYSLLGKVFVIQSGNVSFRGGQDLMPELDIIASYTFRDKERIQRKLIINVEGEAASPKIAFMLDDSQVSEGDALSYILFGSSMDALGSADQNKLNKELDVSGMAKSAAISLLTSQLTKLLGSTFDLDYISYKTNQSTGNGSFVVGKYITNNLFVSYERNFGNYTEQDKISEYEMKLEYELFNFLFMELTSSPIRSGIDVVLKLNHIHIF